MNKHVPMSRRRLLQGVAVTALAATAGAIGAGPTRAESWVRPRPKRPGYRATMFVPGYHPEIAYIKGHPALEDPGLRGNVPAGYKGDIVLLNRVPEDGGEVIRMLMPVKGHDVDVHPDGHIGIFNSQNGTTMVSFDPASLELGVLHTFEDGVTGGGHSIFLPEGGHLAVTERCVYRPYTGDKTAHEGRIAIRDLKTLKTVETYSCHGIAPHEAQLMADGKHIAVANYGSTYAPDGDDQMPYILDPCITILDLASGKLVECIRPAKPTAKIRHLVAHDRGRIFALQNRFVTREEREQRMARAENLYIPDFYTRHGKVHDALPLLRAKAHPGAGGGYTEAAADDLSRMIRPQSIIYDPEHDHVIASFPGANRVIAFNGADGAVVRDVDTAATGGLRLPRGLGLHPDGEHYIVAGAYQDIALFRRGTHERVHERTIYTLLFGHSHLTAV